MKELNEKRTATSKTFNMGRGQFQSDYYAYPVHYLDQDGMTWADIDTTVVETKAWEFTEGVMTNWFRTYFGDKTSDNAHLYSVEFKGEDKERWINFKLCNALPKSTSIKDNTYRFVDCFDGVDVEYIVLPESVKENIWLKDKSARTEFVFSVKTGGTVLNNSEGVLSINDAEEGVILWSIDKPFLKDAAGKISYGVEYHLDTGEDLTTFSVIVIDEAFLRDAVYPVAIDPTVIIEDSASAQFYRSNSTANTIMGTGADSASGFWWSSIYFSAFEQVKADMINGIELVNAHLDVYVTGTSPSNDARYGNGGAVFYTITSPWTNGSAPSTANSVRVKQIQTPGAAGKWHTIDLKAHLKENFYGLRMAAGGQYTWLYLASPFHATASLRPKLTVQFLVKPVIGFHDGTGTNTGYYSDGYDTIFKLLDFGTLVAGQVSEPKKVFVKNLAGFAVTNLMVYVSPSEFPEKLAIEISPYNSPFIPEEAIWFSGIFEDGAESAFYVRISTQEDTMSGGDFNIYSKAAPV